MQEPLRIGTRGSSLALWQAQQVVACLAPLVAPRPVEVVVIETHGDRDQASALSSMGGFGVFTKAIQQALLERRVDVAVHSLKDLPTVPTPGVEWVAVLPRGPSGDAFVSVRYDHFEALPEGAVVGTSSLRRRAQLCHRRPDLHLQDLRGNVDTRLRKLQAGLYDAIILAEAGLVRLGLHQWIREVLDPRWMLPAVGQGAIGIECRSDDTATRQLLQQINDPMTWACVQAERAMLAALGGGCLVPIGAHSRIIDHQLWLRGVVLSPDGRRCISATHQGPLTMPQAIGIEVAARLRAEGADELLPR
ncbi:MAG: hydroxymethylbilane synthase [Gemmataceae bacterium]|nr:hydroxymethylbilane synthase [Gemmataceae bacterium]